VEDLDTFPKKSGFKCEAQRAVSILETAYKVPLKGGQYPRRAEYLSSAMRGDADTPKRGRLKWCFQAAGRASSTKEKEETSRTNKPFHKEKNTTMMTEGGLAL